jgi:peptidoglycan/LPS O-acetylase OafA/YrhL
MPAPPTNPTVTPAEPLAREVGLDVLRAGAMLLVVLFHAAVPHVLTPLNGLVWAVSESEPSRLLDVLFRASHAVQMPLLFFLSGFLAVPALERRGTSAFLTARLRRLGLPILVPGLAVLVVLYYVWSAGWLLEGRCTLREIRAVKFADPAIRGGFLGPAHLWFLEELLAVTFLWTGARAFLGARRSGRWLVPACALGGFTIATLAPGTLTAFHNGLWPDPGRLAWHALFFFAGAASSDVEAARRRTAPLAKLPSAGVPAATAVLAFAAAHPLLPSVSAGSAPALVRAGFAAAWTLAAWGGVLAFFAYARRRTFEPGPRLALLVEASFWIYLVHVPLVGALQIALAPSALPPVAAWALVSAGAAGLSLLSWLPVRRTALGNLLSGGRSRR